MMTEHASPPDGFDGRKWAELSVAELDALTIRVGCETAINRYAEIELKRRGYRFNASEARWELPWEASESRVQAAVAGLPRYMWLHEQGMVAVADGRWVRFEEVCRLVTAQQKQQQDALGDARCIGHGDGQEHARADLARLEAEVVTLTAKLAQEREAHAICSQGQGLMLDKLNDATADLATLRQERDYVSAENHKLRHENVEMEARSDAADAARRALKAELEKRLPFVLAQLRHAYRNLDDAERCGIKLNCRGFADGLIAPQIRRLEELAAVLAATPMTRAEAPSTPRRIQLDQFTPAERAIYDAVQAVEAMPADVRLTDAVNLLQAARESVADYVDGIQRRRVVSEGPAL